MRTRKRKFEYFCDDFENIENYEAAKKDNFKGWDCHHRLETHTSDGERRLIDITREELIALGMYCHRPSNELIFLTKKEHSSLHLRGKHRSDEVRKKVSKSKKGKPTWNKGMHPSEETRKKMSEADKGRTPWNKGKHWKLVDGKHIYY